MEEKSKKAHEVIRKSRARRDGKESRVREWVMAARRRVVAKLCFFCDRTETVAVKILGNDLVASGQSKFDGGD